MNQLALIDAGLGEKDQAFDFLEMVYLKMDPRFDGLRSDPLAGPPMPDGPFRSEAAGDRPRITLRGVRAAEVVIVIAVPATV
jgi:hypothetical protein